MRWVTVVGARPQFVKVATVCRAIAQHNDRREAERIEDLLVHTGQHYDASLSATFFEELDIPREAINLAIGSGSHGVQTARMLEGIETFLLQARPDVVVVYGDTNSTLAGALAAVKLHIPVAHVESGLRSNNRRMPEEINRIATDHISDLLLAPTQTAMSHLQREGLATRARLVGDVMFDAVLQYGAAARSRSKVLASLGIEEGAYGVVTVHRAETTAARELRALLDALNTVASNRIPLVFPMHPRTRNVLSRTVPDWRPAAALNVIEPLGYLDMLRLVGAARMVLTDSGGLQKEAFFLGCPCITLRTETEWIETVEQGANIVCGLEPARLHAAVDAWLSTSRNDLRTAPDGPFGNGTAAVRIVEEIANYVLSRER